MPHFKTIRWILLIVGFGLLPPVFLKRPTQKPKERDEPGLVSYPSVWVEKLFFGHEDLYHHYLSAWLSVVLFDATDRSAEDVAQMVDAVLRHKPKIEKTYLESCYTFALQYKRPDLCENVLLEGTEVLPKSWKIPYLGGHVLSVLMHDEERARSFYHIAKERRALSE